jgi:hypothetical protein
MKEKNLSFQSRVPCSLYFALIWLLVFTMGCLDRRPYHPTPIDALTEFPGYIHLAVTDSVEVLQSETIAGGHVILYRFPLRSPYPAQASYCLATTFVTQERSGSWRSQSASRIGCYDAPLNSDRFAATYTIGGNVTDLTTVYGFSGKGSQVRIEWSDGLVDIVPFSNNTFLKSRPERLLVNQVALLDIDANVLESIEWRTHE